MIGDAWTVMCKDLRALRAFRSQGLSGVISTLLILILFGIIVPWRLGVGWAAHPVSLLLWIGLPWLSATVVVADTFAGERERHTLDALYVTRLSNDAILLGKVGASALFAWLVALLTLALSAVTLSLTGAAAEMPFSSLLILATLSMLSATLAATLGAVVSLRASSARHAQQSAIGVVLSLAFLTFLGGQVAAQYFPAFWRRMMQAGPLGSPSSPALIISIVGLLVLEIVLLGLAARCVARSRLGSS
jgi:ABC-2 type transport system permease protein